MIDNPACVSDCVSCKFNINNCIKIEITIVMVTHQFRPFTVQFANFISFFFYINSQQIPEQSL